MYNFEFKTAAEYSAAVLMFRQKTKKTKVTAHTQAVTLFFNIQFLL